MFGHESLAIERPLERENMYTRATNNQGRTGAKNVADEPHCPGRHKKVYKEYLKRYKTYI